MKRSIVKLTKGSPESLFVAFSSQLLFKSVEEKEFSPSDTNRRIDVFS